MRRIALLLCLLSLSSLVFSQVPNGLTGVRDTSFSLYTTYVKTKAKYPAIQIAAPALPAGVRVAMNVVYAQPNGRSLHLDAFYPAAKGRKRYPAVLLIHGGGWRSGDRSQQIPMAQQLAAQGYVAVTAEYRLSTEALYPAAVHDLKAAVRWLRANAAGYGIDTTKIAALGCSAGGQLAALLGTSGGVAALEGPGLGNPDRSSRVQAVVDVDGILAFIHPESGEGDDSRATSAATYWFGGPKTEKAARWNEASALTYVRGDTTGPRQMGAGAIQTETTSDGPVPMLFINSSVARMHAGRDDLIQQLTARGIYTEVHTFADAPHPFWLFHPWFEPTMTYTVNFLNKVFGYKP